MDGVMADVYHQLVQFEKEIQEEKLKSVDLAGKPEIESFPNGKST